MQQFVNYDAVFDQLSSHGFDISELVTTGDMVRVKRNDSSQKGWYVLNAITLDDGSQALIGSFGYWLGAEAVKKKIAPGGGGALSKDQRDALKRQHQENAKRAAARRQREIDRASKRAAAAWAKYVPQGESDYLKRKAVKSYGLRYSPTNNGTLAIPMLSAKGQMMGLQIIRGKNRPKGKMEKEYWPKGLGKEGAFHLIGGTPVRLLLITEGYATAASLHEASGLPVAVAWDAGNLKAVAVALHKQYPQTKILICADDDYLVQCHQKVDGKKCGHQNLAGADECEKCNGALHHKGHTGFLKAEAAAVAVSGAVILPEFPFDRQRKKLTDFNDLANAPDCSLNTVRQQIEDKLKALGWVMGDKSVNAATSRTLGGGAFVYQPAVSVMSVDEVVERFIPIDDGLGDSVFDLRTNKVVNKKQMLALLEAGKKMDDIKRHFTWIERGSYYLDEIGFDPTSQDKSVKLNTWTGFPMQMTEGIDEDEAVKGCDKLLQILMYLVSKEKNSGELYDWIIKWMAYPLQNQGAKMASAVILHGPQGTGKSLLFKALARIYGRYSTVIGNSGIEDKFNADWSDSKLFILAEEIATSQDKWNIKNELKELITGETVRVRGMYSAAYYQRNCMNVGFLSNESLPLPIEHDDRRHCVVYTPPPMAKSVYIDAVEQLDNGGYQAFYDYLMSIDLEGFNRHTAPPMSEAKDDLINMSMSSHESFIKEWLEGDLSLPICPCPSQMFYEYYKSWCSKNGEKNHRAKRLFLGDLKKKTGWFVGRQYVHETTFYDDKPKQISVVWPPDEVIDQKLKRSPDKTEREWLTDCVIDFTNAFNGHTDENGNLPKN